MIKRYKLILISVFALVAALCLFAGCKLNVSFDDVINDNELTGGHMTYFINVGGDDGMCSFENKLNVKEMYFRKNTKPFNIGKDALNSGNCTLSANYGFSFIGWYLVELNADGVPVYEDNTPYIEDDGFDTAKRIKVKVDADGNPIPFDFNTVFENGEHYYVCARWFKEARLNIKLVTDGFDVLEKDGQEYKTGDIIGYSVFNSESGINKLNNPFSASGYTFLSYHENADDKTEYTGWPILKPEEGDAEIYARYIKGDWTVVREASDVEAMYAGGCLENYYFYNGESKEIDCTGLSVQRPNVFMGKIYGNGFTLKNLTLTVPGMLGNTGVASMFGSIVNAELRDITFENVSMTLNVQSRANPAIYFVFNQIDTASVVENVNISGTMEINLNTDSQVSRMTEDNWLFGGVGRDSNYTNISVSAGTKCTIYNRDKTVFAEYEVK